jgi:hypothetical protein
MSFFISSREIFSSKYFIFSGEICSTVVPRSKEAEVPSRQTEK